jgi:hypothetical protein
LEYSLSQPCFAELRSHGELILDELLAHIAPLRWEHITFNSMAITPVRVHRSKEASALFRNPRASFLDAA